METAIWVLKNVNSTLVQFLVDNKRQCWENSQYTKRECPEVADMLVFVGKGQPKSKESQIFTKVEVEVDGKEFSSGID